MKNIAVIFGGKSSEHDISVITGVMTANSLNKIDFCAIPVYIDVDGIFWTGEPLKNVEWFKTKDFNQVKRAEFSVSENRLYILKKNKRIICAEIYCAINCCHGLNGEDGSVAGLLSLTAIPSASPDILSSAIAIDKCATKLFLDGLKIPKVPHNTLLRDKYYANPKLNREFLIRKFGFPMIIKPARLGSSIGIKTCNNEEELENALSCAFRFDYKVLAEKFLESFTELNCAAYRYKDGIIFSRVESPERSDSILTFSDKYEKEHKSHITSLNAVKVDKSIEEKIREYTAKVYSKLDVVGVIRIDFLLSEGKIYINEINTIPGSLAYYLFCDSFKDFSAMLTRLIEEGVRRFLKENNREYVFGSKVLNIDSSKTAKGCKNYC